MTVTIRWLRDEAGKICLFKHDHDLYSAKLANDDDDIVVLKARVRTPRPVIVAVPVTRDLLNNTDVESLCSYLTNEALNAADRLAMEIARGARINFTPNGDLPNATLEAGVLPNPDDVDGEESLQKLLAFIRGEIAFTRGITTYPESDENNQRIHDACLELERRGLIYKHLDEGDSIVWMPVRPEPVKPL